MEEIKSSTHHDVLEMSGSRAVWPEVLAVYAVKTTTDPDNGQEVASMDDSKKALLKDIFWQMNNVSFKNLSILLDSLPAFTAECDKEHSFFIL